VFNLRITNGFRVEGSQKGTIMRTQKQVEGASSRMGGGCGSGARAASALGVLLAAGLAFGPCATDANAQFEYRFQRWIGTNSPERGTHVVSTRDGGFLVVGERLTPLGDPQVWVLKLNFLGQTEREVVVGFPNARERPRSAVQTADGGYAIAGEALGANQGGTFVIKLSPVLGFVWGRIYQGAPLQPGEAGARVEELSNRDLVVASRAVVAPPQQSPSVARFTSAGVPIFASAYVDPSGTFIAGGLIDITQARPTDQTANEVVASGFLIRGGGPRIPHVLRVNVVGAPTASRIFLGANVDRFYNSITNIGNGELLVGGPQVGTTTAEMLRLSPAFVPAWSRLYRSIIPADASIRLVPAAIADVRWGGTFQVGPGNDEFTAQHIESVGGTVINQFRYGGTASDIALSLDSYTQDTQYVMVGSTQSFGPAGDNLYIIKTDNRGFTGCNEGPFAPVGVPLTLNPSDAPLTISPLQVQQYVPPVTPIQTPNRVICITCPADFNQDGIVDFFDYLDFVTAWSAGQPAGDFNGDSTVDFFDYLDFVAAFDLGCD
jgi:hypothetical protein